MEESAAAIIVAAGGSTRMGRDKLLLPLAGRPLLAHTLTAFEQCDTVDEVVVVLSANNAEQILPLLSGFPKVLRTAMGGDRRQDSVRNGLHALAPREFIVVHDGARPLLTPDLITAGIAAARDTGAAAAALPVVDTLKEVDHRDIVTRTPPREGLWAVQTPQVFRYNTLLRAHTFARGDVTDDCMLVEAIGEKVKLYPGERANLKVTTPEDIAIADAILRARAAAAKSAARAATTARRKTAG